ncbi:MAG: hypothetical protein Tsb002_05220 [Wenzhouxiangellaceae bacterium]
MGAAAAAQATDNLLRHHQPDLLLSFGSAAGLIPSVTAGQLLIANQIVGESGSIHPVQEAVVRWLETRLAALKPMTAPLVQVREVLGSAMDKQRAGAESGACAADMESAAIAVAAQRHGILYAAVRAAVDGLQLQVPGSLVAACDERGDPRWPLMIKTLLAQPRLLGLAPDLARARKRASQSLKAAARLLQDK